jgi:hypothetical protein
MTKSGMSRLIKIALVLTASLMISQPAFGEDVPEQGKIKFKAKIFGDQLMLINEMGIKSTAKDGVYTTEDGTKITVEHGNIIDIPPTFKSKGAYSSFRIIEVEYSETN